MWQEVVCGKPEICESMLGRWSKRERDEGNWFNTLAMLPCRRHSVGECLWEFLKYGNIGIDSRQEMLVSLSPLWLACYFYYSSSSSSASSSYFLFSNLNFHLGNQCAFCLILTYNSLASFEAKANLDAGFAWTWLESCSVTDLCF